MRCEESMGYIRQALIDYGSTMAPSARAAFDQVAQHHFDTVAAELEGDGEEEIPPAEE